MPWFCNATAKKKRSSKTRVSGVGKLQQRVNDRALSNDTRPTFAVVLQSFASSVGDELRVQRGQVVEVMYHDGDWTFVRNLDAGSGYVPKTYCLAIDKVKGDFNNSMLNHVSGPLPRPRVINVDTLQRSGSSVNSVEVHQVTSTSGLGAAFSENSEPTDNSASRTSSSSHVIYEVPRSPAMQRHSGGSASQPTPEIPSSEFTPSPRAPSLPPRSAHLPSSAEMQRQQWASPSSSSVHRPVFLPGCRQGNNPFAMVLPHAQQGGPPTQSQMLALQRSGSYRSTTSGLSPCPGYHPHSSIVPAHYGGVASHQTTPTPGSTHPMIAHNSSSSHGHPFASGPGYRGFSENSPSTVSTPATRLPSGVHTRSSGITSSLQHTSPVGVAGSDHNPGITSSLNLGRQRFSLVGMPGDCSQQDPQAEFSAHMAYTPRSAGVPLGAPSPTSAARVAVVTPGSPGIPATTPGGRTTTTKPRFAAMPSGASAVETHPPWSRDAGGNRTPPSSYTHQRAHTCRYRRHSSDVMLLESSILEDSNVVTYSSPPQTIRHRQRRQSQPCVASLGLHRSPPRRPTRLLVRRTLSMQEPRQSPGKADNIARSVPIRRAPSYQEAVLGDEERRLGATASLKPSELIARSARTPVAGAGSQSCDHKHIAQSAARTPGAVQSCDHHKRQPRERRVSSGSYEMEPDDVFLPDAKKPFGIYKCTKAYQQSFQGEISLKKNELVIVLDQGRGDWAWAITSDNNEGLIPKSVLAQYHSDLGAGWMLGSGSLSRCRNKKGEISDAGTQTDLASNMVAGTSIGAGRSSSDREELDSATPADTDVQSCPKEWFDTMDSVDAAKILTRICSEPSHTMPLSDRATPLGNTADQPTAHTAKKDAASPTKKKPSRPKIRKAASLPHQYTDDRAASGLLVKSGTVHYHDRISGVGSVSFENASSPANAASPEALHRGVTHTAKSLSSMLTVIKDYTPPATSKNCLSLKRGDVLHLQPHMHYPKGWMWVWHTRRRSFGFVPKSYVAYTYDPPRRERRDTLEDDV